MSTFSYRLFLDEIPYSVYVDSFDDKTKIVVNNKVVLDEEYESKLFFQGLHIVYYQLQIRNYLLTVSIDEEDLERTYNLYVDGVSVIDNSQLNRDYLNSCKIVEGGAKNFFRNMWKISLKKYFLHFVGTLICMFALGYYSLFKIGGQFLILCLLLPVWFPILLYAEWREHKKYIKKYHECFKPIILIDDKRKNAYDC